MSGLYVKLDVEYMTNPKLLEAGPLAELIYVRSLCFAKRTMRDGFLSESQTNLITFGVPSAKKHVKKLVDSGLWIDAEDGGYRIAGWLERNKSAKQIEREADRKRQASELANHKRWHEGPDGKPSPTCSLCHPDDDPKSDPKSDRSAESTETEEETETEPKPEEEPKPETETTPPPLPTDSRWTPETLAGEVGMIHARNEAQRGGVRSIPKLAEWKAKELRDAFLPRLESICKLSGEYQDLTGDDPIPASVAARSLLNGDEWAFVSYQQDIDRIKNPPPEAIGPMHGPPVPEPPKLSAEERKRLMREAGAPDHFIDPDRRTA